MLVYLILLYQKISFFDVVRGLESTFKYDYSILMQVSHVHRAPRNQYTISYLVLYKASLYTTSSNFIKWCKSILLKKWGEHIFDRFIQFFDQEALIKDVFQKNVLESLQLSSKIISEIHF